MKIQIDKKYIDGYGDIIEIISTTTKDNYKFLSQYGTSYTKEGFFISTISQAGTTLYVK